MPPKTGKTEFSVQSQPNVYVFDINEEKAYKKQHDLKIEKYKISNAEPDWKAKREQLDQEYEKRKKILNEALLKEKQYINERYDAMLANNEKDEKQKKKESLDKLAADAKKIFPVPLINVSFSSKDTPSFTLGKTQEEKEAQISEMASNSVSSSVSKFFLLGFKKYKVDEAEKTTFSISFNRSDKDLISAVKENRKTLFRIPVKSKNSPEFDAFQKSIKAFDDAFNKETALGEDYLSSTEKVNQFRNLLSDIKTKSRLYLDKRSGFRITSSGRLRVEMAENAFTMASAKLEALDKALSQAKEFEEARAESRSEFVNSYAPGIEDAVKQEFDDKNSKLNLDRQDKLKKADSKNNWDLDKAKKKYDQNVAKLEKEHQSYNRAALSEGNTISSSSFAISDKIAFEDLTADQQYNVCNAKFANMIFGEEHNPFADHMEYVPADANPGELPVNKKARENAIPLRKLKQSLRSKDIHIPVTYNTDSLITLSNLQLYDTMTGVKREKNDYLVSFEFVDKFGKHLPSSALETMGAEKLAAQGYDCFVTGIKADFRQAKHGGFGVSDNFDITQRSMIPLETAERIMNLEPAYVRSMINQGSHKTNANPSEFFSKSIARASDLISKRSAPGMIKKKSTDWQKFNIMSTKALKKNIASKNIDFRPVRPSKALSKKKYPINGFVAQQAKYFDADLMAHLDMNIISAETKKYEFDRVFNDKLLSEDSLTISRNYIRTGAFDRLLETRSDDPKLEEICREIKQVLSMNTGDVLDYGYKYLTNDGASGKIPADNEYLKTQSCENEYDLQAAKVYSLIEKYTRDHKEELSDSSSPVSLLNDWRDKAYPKGSPAFNEKDPNAVVINASVEDETDSDLNFNGDGDYLIGAKLSFNKTDYWGVETDSSVAKKYGINSDREFYMKDFRDEPLFTREPSLGDIKQGEIGNCYFLSYISAEIGANPDAIKNMIRDNNDGTVTCKFFNELQQPMYITMNKTVPYVKNPSSRGEFIDIPASGEKAPLWFHLLQKGYILSGLRPVDRLKDADPLEMRKLHDVYVTNMGGKKGDALDTIKGSVLAERFKKAGNKGQELINNSSDKLFRRIMDRALFNMDGGQTADVYKKFTGKTARRKDINTPEASYTIKQLRSLERNNNPFCSDGLKNLKDEDFDVLQELCREAASKLTVEKSRYSKDLAGNEFVELERINMDDILDTMKDAAENPGSRDLQQIDAKKRMEMFECFSEKFRDYQMNDPQPNVLYVSQKNKQYSNYAQKLFTAVKNHTDKHHGISCSFNTKSIRRDDGKELDLSFNAEAISDGGHIHGHEFSVAGYKIDGDRKILYIRNPWGDSEKQIHNVELADGNEKESFTYSSLKTDRDVNTKDNGVFELDLNDFMEFADDISFLDDKPGLNRNEIETNLTKQYLEMYKKKNPAKYDILMEKISPEKVTETVKASPIIQNLTHDVYDLTQYREKIEDGIDLSEAELKDMDKLEQELDKVFLSQPQKTAVPNNTLGKQQDELSAVNKGISAH